MARQARQLSPTGCYHVMMRGNNKERVFSNAKLKRRFIKIMLKAFEQSSAELLAWCIMDNHVHIVLRTEEDAVGDVLKKINISYAMSYNADHKRIGHVFQDRFRSEVISDDNYLMAVVRYVHQNPIKAGLTVRLEDYAFSSYPAVLKAANDKTSPAYNLIFQLFNCSRDQLIEFHQMEDDREYLEIPEEQVKQRLIQANKIIEAYSLDRNGLKSLDPLIRELLSQTKLSRRKIAEILGVSTSKVDRACRVEKALISAENDAKGTVPDVSL